MDDFKINVFDANKSVANLITLYEAWNKPEKAEKWRATLTKTEAVIE